MDFLATKKFGSALSLLAVAAFPIFLVAAVIRAPEASTAQLDIDAPSPALSESYIDVHFASYWSEHKITPADFADDLTVLRRASLALHGSIPSLEEIRAVERDPRDDRLAQWVRNRLADPRFADYFAERLARVWVGLETEPFLVYRRDRFTRWLSEQLRQNRPFDEVARGVLSTNGLWTSEPAANFVTAAVANDELNHNELAARTVRGFLGQRIDCAECHDHPFADWKQSEFQGLAAFFGHSAVSFQGVVDQPHLFADKLGYFVDSPTEGKRRVVEPSVPFLAECLPSDGLRRNRLAAWVTHRQNTRFARATVNRIWGLLFGRPYVDPVDDLPDPGHPDTVLLDRLGEEFLASGYDLRWLIEEIILSKPFRLSSSLPEQMADSDYRAAEKAWALFPVTRLRPEQFIGAMIQAGRLQTLDQNSNLFARTIRFFREQDFVKEYGDLGEAELDSRSGTISQALLRMNGQLTNELLEANPFNATGRIASLAQDDNRLVETCFLVTLTRRPTNDERSHFIESIRGATGEDRSRAAEDLLWTLVNTVEFAWNH